MSVIESVIPKSKNNTLPANLAPSISLGILPNAVFPSVVLQSNFNASSERLIRFVPGTSTLYCALLFERLQVPELPSLNESVTGTLASLTMVAHEVKKTKIEIEAKVLNIISKKHGCSIANIATRFILDKPQVAGVIIGARLGITEHMKDNNKVFGLKLDQDDISSISAITSKSNDLFDVIGDCGDEYR